MFRVHLILFIVVTFQQGKSQYHAQIYDSKDGLASTYSQTIVQDNLGFIWIQYPGGLTRFDGYNFKIYKHDPEQPDRSPGSGVITQVIADQHGNIWAIGNYKAPYLTLSRYNRAKDNFIHYEIRITNRMEGLHAGEILQSVRFAESGNHLWLATRSGLYRFDIDSRQTVHYWHARGDSKETALNNYVTDVSVQDSKLLISTRNGLWSFDTVSETYYRPECNPNDSTWLYHAELWKILDAPKDDSGNSWLVHNDGFASLDRSLTILKQVNLPGGLDGFGVFNYAKSNEGEIWIASVTKGLYRYNDRSGSLSNINSLVAEPGLFDDNIIYGVAFDKSNNVWVSSERGLIKLRKQTQIFYNINTSKGNSSSLFSGIHASFAYKTRDKDFVIINHYKKNDRHEILVAPIINESLGLLRFRPLIRNLKGRAINAFAQGKNNLWLAVWGTGIQQLTLNSDTTGVIKGNLAQVFSHDPQNNNTISSNYPRSVMEDGEGNLWVGTQDKGISKIIRHLPYGTNGAVLHYQNKPNDSTSLISNAVFSLHPENDSSFWVVTEEGIDLFENGRFKHVFRHTNRPRGFFKSVDGHLFVGTSSGLYEGTRSDDYYFNKLDILNNKDILTIQDDQTGRLWICTPEGIACYDRSTKTAIEFSQEDGIHHWRSMYSHYLPNETRNGIIIISDYDGITMFNPSSFQPNLSETFPMLTVLKVNNQTSRVGLEQQNKYEFLTDTDITLLDELRLDHQHNNFSLEFSAMEFTAPEKNRYRHKLEGYDNDWIETDAKTRTATYTNLNPGHYIFRVRASNHHGIWNDNETTLAVVILPPPWKTWWAYSFYGILILTAVLYWRRYELRRVRLTQRAEHLAEVDQLKTRFFANISHEFRTPLTLILGPLQDLYNNARSEQRTLFAMMINNAQRLLRLINQLLDLSKLEAGKMIMQSSRVELVSFLRQIISAYELPASDRRIQLSLHSDAQALFFCLDHEKIEKVMHNLLSNALKFTHHGSVVVSLKGANNQFAEITVKDTGIGIPEDQLDKVFDRFYQVDNSQIRAYEGSGLGMALAKELVGLHHGEISVESTFGKGTTFTVWLPDAGTLPHIKSISSPARQLPPDNNTPESNRQLPPQTDHSSVAAADAPLLLIVEDNADMRSYIHRILSAQYRIMEASEGMEGVSQARQVIPDLIISDIMMPGLDGYRLCELIKTDELTSHVPVILLTAKADRHSKLTGLETGADDYLSKPFDAEELKLIIRNRINERKTLRERFSREITLEPKHMSISSLDERFIRKVLDIIEDHIDDEHFSIVRLSAEAGYSHIQFYRKIKALSGQAPNQFLKTIRLKRAADLLRTKSDNVAQIAYSVGFSSQSYFIKCFKQQYGVTPGEFTHQELTSKDQS